MTTAVLPAPPATPAPPLMTAEEFSAKYADKRAELIRGRVVELPMPHSRHGQVCNRAAFILTAFVDERGLGHVLSHDTLFVTRRNPDSSLGMDVCFISYGRVPKGPMPDAALEIAPELVLEVRSPSDRWTAVMTKVIDYLSAGVTAVVVLDPNTSSASVFRDDARQETFEVDQTLVVPDVLPGFAVPVGKLFE